MALFSSTVFLFALSLITVFYGFVAYSSRVNLAGEFQNIDYVFLTLEQLEKDEADISKQRTDLSDQLYNVARRKLDVQVTAYTSSEFRDLFETYSEIIKIFEQHRDVLKSEYFARANAISFDNPEVHQFDILSSPAYASNASPERITALTNELNPRITALRPRIITYVVKYAVSIQQLDSEAQAAQKTAEVKIREIARRYPHLVNDEEKKKYGISEKSTLDLSQVDKQRAIIHSYDQGLARLRTILRWPTIILTLLVTLAAGLLGGIVSFLGPVLRPREQNPMQGGAVRSEFLELVRRCMLGVTAALGIFLFAGSGLLVLTAQSGKALTSSSLELSPYFVAFLAFISGFLADDAFRRLTEAGRAILQARGGRVGRGAPARAATGRRAARKR